ncbi:hypothetical protein SALBM217S_01449 [Streptomyces griseoloalbus]
MQHPVWASVVYSVLIIAIFRTLAVRRVPLGGGMTRPPAPLGRRGPRGDSRAAGQPL